MLRSVVRLLLIDGNARTPGRFSPGVCSEYGVHLIEVIPSLRRLRAVSREARRRMRVDAVAAGSGFSADTTASVAVEARRRFLDAELVFWCSRDVAGASVGAASGIAGWCDATDSRGNRDVRALLRLLSNAAMLPARSKARDARFGGLERLTAREIRVLGLYALARTSTEIADRLQNRPDTVRRDLLSIRDKLGTATNLLTFAQEAALVNERRLLAPRGRRPWPTELTEDEYWPTDSPPDTQPVTTVKVDGPPGLVGRWDFLRDYLDEFYRGASIDPDPEIPATAALGVS